MRIRAPQIWFATVAVLAALAAGRYALQRDALRRIVQTQCLVSFRLRGDPAPCARVVLPATGDATQGFAILKDRKPGVHFLLIPTRTLTGIESAVLLDAAAPNYFAAAWGARDLLEQWYGHPLPRDALGLAVNPHTARGQDQLHIHMECVGQLLEHTLAMHAEQLGTAWTTVEIGARPFRARRLMGETLAGTDPFHLLAQQLPGTRPRLDRYTLIVAGRTFRAGPGFVLLAGRGAPGGETLLDAGCTVVKPPGVPPGVPPGP
jgi:CDP-diacylglycerol pyrophosphatase